MNMNHYNIKWQTQSKDCSESMPVGGYDLGANVWVEKNQILLYLQQSGWFDENNSLLKAGRWRIEVSPNPFTCHFSQELILKDGYINIAGTGFAMNIWASVEEPVLHIEYESEIKRKVTVYYENWRTKDREIDHCSYELFQCKEMYFYPLSNPVFHKDNIEAEKERLFFFHQNDNEDLSIDKEFQDQGIEEYLSAAFNPQRDLICGGMMKGTALRFAGNTQGQYKDTRYVGYCYRMDHELCRGEIAIALQAIKTKDVQELKQLLSERLERVKRQWEQDRKKAKRWWNDYFEKSFILGEAGDEKLDEVMKNYQLFRYMLGCNFYGYWPTKFNGGLFTFDPSLGGESPWSEDKLEYTPDYRLWGGGSHTIQNQRLLYWPMLKAGDVNPMKQHFDFFNRTLGVAKYRCKKNMGITGAMYPEQVGTYGLCCGCDNEWGNKTGLPVTQIKYLFSNSLETVLMILEYYRYTGNDISEYLDFMENIVLFYHNFYHKNDENGKMIMYPANVLETYHVVKNPVDGIAGLQAVVERMLELPEELFAEDKKKIFRIIQSRIPEIKTTEKDGHTIIAYADTKSLVYNCELPELYTVFPYGQFGIGKEQLQLARDTARYAWQTEEQLSHISWHSTGIQYARLGMQKECEEFIIKKLQDGPFRFPAFWGPGHDWTPDHNWGGSGMIQLQDMLLQTEKNELRVLPCWNPDINVHFKLMAPYNTTVECTYKDGNIVELQVTPESRKRDIVLPEWLNQESTI